MKERVLIVEDDQDLRDTLCEILDDAGYESIAFPDARQALKLINEEREVLDLVITDIRMPGVKGDEILFAVRACRVEAPIIVITAFGSVEHAVEMVKAGAHQYITKPFHGRELLAAVEQALEHSAPLREQAKLRREMNATQTRIIGASRPMRSLLNLIARAAQSNSTVLITGESGTGKELVARAIHELSGRKGQFVPVNCPAIPAELMESEFFGHTGQAFTGAKQARAGLFETADGGTIFLDEIGDLDPGSQVKLLRVLQDRTYEVLGSSQTRTVDVRVVSATNRNLPEMVAHGQFREDLLYRLNLIAIHLPSLRERSDDIPLIAGRFLENLAKVYRRADLTISGAALRWLQIQPWPGNVRQLRHVIERALLISGNDRLEKEDFEMTMAMDARADSREDSQEVLPQVGAMTLDEIEKAMILKALKHHDGNISKVADALGLSRAALYRRFEKFGIKS